MNIEIGLARTTAEREAIYRLRYEVYVEEMNIFGEVADHSERLLTDAHDDAGHLVQAKIDGVLVGTVRLNWGGDGPFSEEHRETYGLDRFLRVVSASQILVVTRLVLRREVRGGPLTAAVLRCAAQWGKARETDLTFCDCQPHLVSLYMSYGFRSYTVAYNDAAFGIMVPLVLVGADTEHLNRVSSPLAESLAGWRPLTILGTVLALLEDEPPIRDAVDATTGDMRPHVQAVIDSRRDDVPGLFDGLDDAQIRNLLQRGHIIECRRGDKVIRRGQVTRTIFVVLAGTLEAQIEGRQVNRVHPGESAGEIAFLHGVPRTVDLVAESEGVVLLSLNEKVVRGLMESDQALGYRLMLNLARGLGLKLLRRDIEMGQRVANATTS